MLSEPEGENKIYPFERKIARGQIDIQWGSTTPYDLRYECEWHRFGVGECLEIPEGRLSRGCAGCAEEQPSVEYQEPPCLKSVDTALPRSYHSWVRPKRKN